MGGGELDGKRQPVHLTADLTDVAQGVVRGGEAGTDRTRPFEEEPHRRGVGQFRLEQGSFCR